MHSWNNILPDKTRIIPEITESITIRNIITFEIFCIFALLKLEKSLFMLLLKSEKGPRGLHTFKNTSV